MAVFHSCCFVRKTLAAVVFNSEKLFGRLNLYCKLYKINLDLRTWTVLLDSLRFFVLSSATILITYSHTLRLYSGTPNYHIQNKPSGATLANNMRFRKPFPTPTSTLPFWRTERSDIDEIRTSEELPTECDVLIIGSGLSGASVAYQLLVDRNESSLPLSVTMLEARQVCSGATGRNGGHCKLGWQNVPKWCKMFGNEDCEALTDFFLAQIPALKAVIEEERIECDFALRRSFDIFYDEKVAHEVRISLGQYSSMSYSKQIDIVTDSYLEQV